MPSFNQGAFLDAALTSLFAQDVPIEVYVVDGGSTDCSLDVIHAWKHRLAGWRSHRDNGQAAAINEAIASGSADYVCWLNSDDWLLPEGLKKLISILEIHSAAPAAYGRVWNRIERTETLSPVWVEPFTSKRLALRCIVSQPATLIRRSAWEGVGGVDEALHMAMDYDLWWKLFKKFGPLQFVDDFIAVNREHADTKTNTQRRRHYREAMAVVKKYNGTVPLKWWIFQPYAVWFKAIKGLAKRQ